MRPGEFLAVAKCGTQGPKRAVRASRLNQPAIMPILTPVVHSNHVKVDGHLDFFTIAITLQKYSPWRIIFFLNFEKD